MAKRSYLDQSSNYRAAKPSMRGMSSGIPEKDEGALQRARLLNSIKESPMLDAAYRRWQLGERQDNGTYSKDPLDLGKFEDFEKDYNSKEATAKRMTNFHKIAHTKADDEPITTNVTAEQKAMMHDIGPKPKVKPKITLIKRQKTDDEIVDDKIKEMLKLIQGFTV